MAEGDRSFPTDWMGRPLEAAQVVRESPPLHEDTDTGSVPEGSIKEVLAWVGYHPVRARRALTAELAKSADDQRSTLIDKLKSIESNDKPEGAESNG